MANSSRRKLNPFKVLIALLLLVGLVVAVALASRSQDTRQKASTGEFTCQDIGQPCGQSNIGSIGQTVSCGSCPNSYNATQATCMSNTVSSCPTYELYYRWRYTSNSSTRDQCTTDTQRVEKNNTSCSNTELGQYAAYPCKSKTTGAALTITYTCYKAGCLYGTWRASGSCSQPPAGEDTGNGGGGCTSGSCITGYGTSCSAMSRTNGSGTCSGGACCGDLIQQGGNPPVVGCGQRCTNFDTCRTGQTCVYVKGSSTCGGGSTEKYCVKNTNTAGYTIATCANANSLAPADTKKYLKRPDGSAANGQSNAQAACN
ncbi:MAG TPA: hypothetical protein VLH19_03215 [Patescibacteria group bacterium]|nr:hypothetical protein [Patescibacteria group bacterium]